MSIYIFVYFFHKYIHIKTKYRSYVINVNKLKKNSSFMYFINEKKKATTNQNAIILEI